MFETPVAPADKPRDLIAETLDRAAFAAIAEATGGVSPATLLLAWADWAIHLMASPGRRMELASAATLGWCDWVQRLIPEDGGATPPSLPRDRRFEDPAWRRWPYDAISDAFLRAETWWQAATTGVMGVSRHHEAMLTFVARQIADMAAPTNFIATNPQLQTRIAETRGECLVDGFRLWLEDVALLAGRAPPAGSSSFVLGRDIATTEGKVVYRNHLIELIQYAPLTGQVRPEPVLIVPAWIMKYYILDLSQENSLIGWLVGQGYSVFAISWRNPDATDRNLDLEDYRRSGLMAAIDAIGDITGVPRLHALGYCLGGTLLTITAAAMARSGDDRLATLTLLATLTDFSQPGELALFIDEAQLNLLDNMMWRSGYLDSTQMGSAFQMLRANDLIWSPMLRTYLMGEREPISDLMAWNADGTRMPYAMHSEYLRSLLLDNDLAGGRFKADGQPVTLSALRQPMFVVGTETDHVAPWRAVHKIHMLSEAEISFVLTNGGHNAGILSEPGHPHRHFRMFTRPRDTPALDPDAWLAQAAAHDGSWWPAWRQWLDAHSGEAGPPPPLGAPDKDYPPLADAPGSYVLQR
jgi:polyhydroxyalkanoate synthase